MKTLLKNIAIGLCVLASLHLIVSALNWPKPITYHVYIGTKETVLVSKAEWEELKALRGDK